MEMRLFQLLKERWGISNPCRIEVIQFRQSCLLIRFRRTGPLPFPPFNQVRYDFFQRFGRDRFISRKGVREAWPVELVATPLESRGFLDVMCEGLADIIVDAEHFRDGVCCTSGIADEGSKDICIL